MSHLGWAHDVWANTHAGSAPSAGLHQSHCHCEQACYQSPRLCRLCSEPPGRCSYSRWTGHVSGQRHCAFNVPHLMQALQPSGALHGASPPSLQSSDSTPAVPGRDRSKARISLRGVNTGESYSVAQDVTRTKRRLGEVSTALAVRVCGCVCLMSLKAAQALTGCRSARALHACCHTADCGRPAGIPALLSLAAPFSLHEGQPACLLRFIPAGQRGCSNGWWL